MKKISPEYHPDIGVFASGKEIFEKTNIIILNLNIYNIFSKNYTLDYSQIKTLLNIFKIFEKIDKNNLDKLAFIICKNPHVLAEYFKKEKIHLEKNVNVLHIQPTSLYFSLFQKEIDYYTLNYTSRSGGNFTKNNLLNELTDINIEFNQSNNYLTPHVIKEKLYEAFIIGGPLLKTYVDDDKDDLQNILIQLETPPMIEKQTLIKCLNTRLAKIGVSLKRFLKFRKVHLQPFNQLHRILVKAYTDIVGEHPYIEWAASPSAVEIFHKFFNITNQLIFGPGSITGQISEEDYDNQLSIFLKIFKEFSNIRGGD
ncbi:MAG: hypothetical protein QW327_02545 [Candidatus Odinarchaeota archaeon]